MLDLPMREADVAIRLKEPSQADLIRRRLMAINMRLYASPGYLADRGTPQSLEDLGSHRLISQNLNAAQVSAGATLLREIMAQRGGQPSDSQQLLRRVAGRDPQSRHRSPAGLPDRRLPRSGPCSARCDIQRSACFPWPIPKNCGPRNGLRCSAISSLKRSSPTAAGGAIASRWHLIRLWALRHRHSGFAAARRQLP